MMVNKEEMEILWDMAKRNTKENSYFKDINSISHPSIQEINQLEVKLDDWRKLPQKGKTYYVEMESPIIPFTKVVSYNGVEYNAVMTRDEYDADKAHKAERKPISDEMCKYFSELAQKCKNGMFKDVMLIQFDRQLAHEQADMKVMLPNANIPPERANYYSIKYTATIVRRDKSLFKEKDGVKIEFFALQSEQEFQEDFAKKKGVMNTVNGKIQMER